jgi:single-stranded-DNA-specific exonuclease
VHRPVIAFAAAGEGDELKGSARSIPGVHIRDLLDRVDRRAPGLILKFGGHAMAAGLSIQPARLAEFTALLQQEVLRAVQGNEFDRIIESDGPVEDGELDLGHAELLRHAGPWGQQFGEPVFDDAFEVLDWRIVGDKHLKLRLRKADSDVALDAIAFNHTDADLPGAALHAAYRLDVNEYNGRRSLQLVIEHMQALDAVT